MLLPSRSLEPENSHIHHALLESSQVQRIYLDELGNPEDQPIGIRLMQLTIAPEPQLIEQGKQLIAQANQGQVGNLSRQDIIEMVTTIAVYKFTQIDRAEVEAMLGINLEESRIYQEIKAEGEQIGELKGKLQLVPLLLELGLTPAQIAERTGIDLKMIQQAIKQSSQTHQNELIA